MSQKASDSLLQQGLTSPPLLPARPLAYNLYELATLTGRHPSRLNKAIREGRLKARRDGNQTIVLHDDALEWLRSLPLRVRDQEAAR